MFLYWQVSMVLTLHPGSFFLKQRETIIENHSQPKCIVAVPSTNWYICNTMLLLRIWKHSEGGSERLYGPEDEKFSVRCFVSPNNVRSYPSIKSHQHGCLSMCWIEEDTNKHANVYQHLVKKKTVVNLKESKEGIQDVMEGERGVRNVAIIL